jgi:hypothetical protein
MIFLKSQVSLTIIPATWEVEKLRLGGSQFQARLGRKFVRPHLYRKKRHGGMHLSSQLWWEEHHARIIMQALAKSKTLPPKQPEVLKGLEV